jgi:hypothetical protein
MIEIIEILKDLKNNLEETKIYFDEKNKIVSKKLNAQINKLNFSINFLSNNYLNKENFNIEHKNQINLLNEKIKKFELICLLHGIDNLNFYINTYKLTELIDLVKENRNNKIVRVPLQLLDIKPKYKFRKNEAGKLVFCGKI